MRMGSCMSVAKTSASRTMSSLACIVRLSPRPGERGYVRAVIGIDALTSLATSRGSGGR
jgi:hypothetical protein